MTSRTVTHCTFRDVELDIYLDIAFISKSAGNEAGAPKLVSTGFIDSLVMMGAAVRGDRGKTGQGRVQSTFKTGICVVFFVSVTAHMVKFSIALLVFLPAKIRCFNEIPSPFFKTRNLTLGSG